MDYIKQENFESKMSIVAQLKPKMSEEDFLQTVKDLHNFMAAGFHTVMAQTTVITYYLYK